MLKQALATLFVLLVSTSFAADEPEAEELDRPLQRAGARLTMAAKLKFAAVILEGVAREDFDLVADGATSMKSVNDLEAFARRRNAEYTAQLERFRKQTDAVSAAAERKDIHAILSAYQQLTASCVSCHQVVRGPMK